MYSSLLCNKTGVSLIGENPKTGTSTWKNMGNLGNFLIFFRQFLVFFVKFRSNASVFVNFTTFRQLSLIFVNFRLVREKSKDKAKDVEKMKKKFTLRSIEPSVPAGNIRRAMVKFICFAVCSNASQYGLESLSSVTDLL